MAVDEEVRLIHGLNWTQNEKFGSKTEKVNDLKMVMGEAELWHNIRKSYRILSWEVTEEKSCT